MAQEAALLLGVLELELDLELPALFLDELLLVVDYEVELRVLLLLHHPSKVAAG